MWHGGAELPLYSSLTWYISVRNTKAFDWNVVRLYSQISLFTDDTVTEVPEAWRQPSDAASSNKTHACV